MIYSILLLLLIGFFAFKAAPRERKEDTHVHGAGQIALLAAIALFGVDYFTSFFYATGEMMSSLHPYGLQEYGYITAGVIAFANLVFGALYIYSLGIFKEGGGSYTASMRYLWPTLSLIVAVTLIQDYILTIVVSALNGADQLLSVFNAYNTDWWWHFLIGAILASITWMLTIQGRGESAKITFTMLGVFVMMTLVMAFGLIYANVNGVPAQPVTETITKPSLAQALMHMLTASMKGMVALSGLEAMSDGIQFVIDEDYALIKWGKKKHPKFNWLWNFYSGKAGVGRTVQTAFLFYGGMTTFMLTYFAIRFNVFDGTLGRSLVGNLAFIGFTALPWQGSEMLYWAYQILAVVLLTGASMTAFQDLQSCEWRNVANGEIPEAVIYRDPHGTFVRSVTISFGIAVIIMFLVRGQTTVAVPFYGVGVFMPIMVMGLAIRKHIQKNFSGKRRFWGNIFATFAAIMAGIVFVGQIVGKWEEGGWVVLISFSVLSILAHLILISPWGYREPVQIHRIVRDKARVQGGMASIVEWQSLRLQEYRYIMLSGISKFFAIFGVYRPVRYAPPAAAGEYDDEMHNDPIHSEAFLAPYLTPKQAEPHLGGAPNVTEASDEDQDRHQT